MNLPQQMVFCDTKDILCCFFFGSTIDIKLAQENANKSMFSHMYSVLG